MALNGFASGVVSENHQFAAIINGYKCQTCPAFMTDSDVNSNQDTVANTNIVGKQPDWLNKIYKTAGGTTRW